MAHPTEQEIMAAIGLGSHYNWYNGSGSCAWIGRQAVEKLPDALQERGMSLSKEWARVLSKALQADSFDSPGGYSLTNVWVACSYAIQDAMYRHESPDSEGVDPAHMHFHFFETEKQEQWAKMEAMGPLSTHFCRYEEPDGRW